ncbi:efflux RND transporter permease subunit [Halioxenophilus sp. WMMB6]|uniref:efflux RND transporter permease subunit n=1 Tax=Halioxenophilus sp. WMMB6 TaxID=3073815 RepID=UPI00295ED371|nr:efflux RND transporter permease subunit [Halioxenophilus sp. WMMB6]
MKGSIAWWVNNPVAANMLMIGIIIAGILGFFRMDREFFPTIRATAATVSVAWPGAAPQEVEEQLVMRIEEALTDLDSIERLRSTASEGLAEISIDGKPGADPVQFMNDIRARVDSIRSFPSDVEPARIRQQVWRNEMQRVAVHGNGFSERELKRMAEKLRDEITLLPGISVVELFGVRPEEVSVELSEEAMRRYRVSFDEVARAIRATSVNTSSGRVKTETGDVQLRTRNLAENEDEFGDVIVRQTEEGAIVRVRDVAHVVDGFEDNEILATLNGEPAVLIQVLTTEQINIVQASESLRAWLAEAQPRMPEGMSLTLWTDMADAYNSRMKTIMDSAFYGLILVCVVLLLTLRPKVAFWVSSGIFTAYCGAFILLPYTDVSINFISTFSFLLVLGIVVDDAIVVGESIHHVGAKKGGPKAAVLGTQLVLKPVIFAVLTTMIAFAPWLFISGEDAQLTRQVSIIIICALSFSLVEAFFILPAHLSKLQPVEPKGRFGKLQSRIEHGLIDFAGGPYKKFLLLSLHNRYTVLAIFFGMLALSVALLTSGWLKFDFMPDIESDEVVVNVDLPDGVPYTRALAVLDQLQEGERKLVAEIEQLAATEGGSGKLIENWYTRSRRESVIAIVKLVPPESRQISAKEAAERLRVLVGDIPDADAVSYHHSLGNWEPDIEYSVSHSDFDVLKAAVAALETQLRSYDNLYDVRSDLQAATEEYRLSLLPGAEKLGLTLAEVSRQVRQAYYGEEVQRLARSGNDVRVMLRYPATSRTNLESLNHFRVRLTDGREVPLLAIAEIDTYPGINRIDRRERKRSSVVSAEMVGDDRHLIAADLEENFFPAWKAQFPGVFLGAVGEAEGEQKFLEELKSLYVMALFAMYALIAIAFKSYWHPVLVMTAIPFGFMGAVFGHMLWGMPMAMFSYLGIGAAAGVVVNDNLVLLDALHRNRDQGAAPFEAIVASAVGRFRPILLTSVTTFVGLLPMMLERSIQAQFLIPTTISLSFGVLFATFVTLLLVPSMYLIGEDIRHGFARLHQWLTVKLLGREPSPMTDQESTGH